MSDSRESEALKSNWVWFSCLDSARQGIFSLLAAAEVLMAVVIYWSFAFWEHTQIHLLIGIFVAPLLLLRSDQSVSLGEKWFRRFDLSEPDTSATNDRQSLQNILNRVARVSPNAAASLMILFVSVSVVAALPIRIIATIRFLGPGVASISNNWWRTLFATDILTQPEIIPGHFNPKSMLHFDDFVRDHKKFSRFLLKNDDSIVLSRADRIGSFFGFVGNVVLYLLVFAPAYIYRLSIKSTAWAHWPLAYIARPTKFADDIQELQLRLWSDPREWLRRVLMLTTIVGVLVASAPQFSHLRGYLPTGVISVAEYAFLIDVKTLFSFPWRAAALFSAAITLFLTWYGWELSLLIVGSMARPNRAEKARKWAAVLEYAMRLRTLCGWIFWGLILVHAGLLLLPTSDWIPSYAREILKAVYGDFLPANIQ